MINQEALTIRAEIKRGQIDRLKTLLGIIHDDVENNNLIPFARLENVHFARFVLLDEQPDDLREKSIRPTLVFASNVDAPLKNYLDELVKLASSGLDQIFSNCEGYPAPERLTNESRISYLLDHSIKTQAFYINTIGRTVRQIHREAQLRNSIENFLEKQQAHDSAKTWTSESIQAAIRNYVKGEPSLKWALTAPPKPSFGRRAGNIFRFVLVICGIVLLIPLLILILPCWLVLLRYHEKKDARQDNLRLSVTDKGGLENTGVRVVQNRISAVGHIKPGWFRAVTLRVLLLALSFAARHVYNKGDLGTFKPLGLVGVNTIHFAQWIMIDDGKRMLFFSNYDGSLVSYMDDFVNKVAWGLNAVFSNGISYPKTNWLFFNGAYDEQAFKAFLQKHQIPTQVWYGAYNQQTALNLTNNSEIRNGLFADLNQQETAQWLQRL